MNCVSPLRDFEVKIDRFQNVLNLKWTLISNYCIYRAIDQLSKLDGSKIFAMSRTDLIAAFGKQEGIRLDSQITISRNSAGYQTAKTSELRNILERARQRSEKSRKSPDDGHAFSMA